MPALQQLLFPDPQPLVERLGRDFFRRLPETPGVYLMRDAQGALLYVGKARNLRKRLASYRVANPDRMPRRHLRLLRAVAQIEVQEQADEAAALAKESELLRSLRPAFNRAGTWPAPPRFLAWRCDAQRLQLAVLESGHGGWRLHGPAGGVAFIWRAVLARLLWLAAHPKLGFSSLPVGWFQGRSETSIDCGLLIEVVAFHLQRLWSGQSAEFCDWIRTALPVDLHPFEKAALEADLEIIQDGLPGAFLSNPANS